MIEHAESADEMRAEMAEESRAVGRAVEPPRHDPGPGQDGRHGRLELPHPVLVMNVEQLWCRHQDALAMVVWVPFWPNIPTELQCREHGGGPDGAARPCLAA